MQFKDTEGRSWDVNITVGAVRRVKSDLGIDLYRLVEDKLRGLQELLENPCGLVDVLWVLVRGQRPDVTDEQFGESLGGDSLQQAADAFLEGLISFFPDQKKRALLRKCMSKGKEMRNRLMEKQDAKVETMDLEAEVDRIIRQAEKEAETASASHSPPPAPGSPPSAAPASSASTLTPGPSSTS